MHRLTVVSLGMIAGLLLNLASLPCRMSGQTAGVSPVISSIRPTLAAALQVGSRSGPVSDCQWLPEDSPESSTPQLSLWIDDSGIEDVRLDAPGNFCWSSDWNSLSSSAVSFQCLKHSPFLHLERNAPLRC